MFTKKIKAGIDSQIVMTELQMFPIGYQEGGLKSVFCLVSLKINSYLTTSTRMDEWITLPLNHM